MTAPALTDREKACLRDCAGGPLRLTTRWAAYVERLALARAEGREPAFADERRRLFFYSRDGAGEHFSGTLISLAAKGLVEFDRETFEDLGLTAAGRRVVSDMQE
jgi:hypothetical protein